MDLITIATFSNSIEAHISRSLLESQGIPCFLKDEHTINANPMYHLALGGIKLQVWEKDVVNAVTVMKGNGYSFNELKKTKDSKPYKNGTFWGKFNSFPKILLGLIFLSALIIVPLVWLTLPNKKELLMQNSWCVERVSYLSTDLPIYSYGMKISNGKCEEVVTFYNGTVNLPGINTYPIECYWKFEEEKLKVFSHDTLAYIYSGLYDVNIKSHRATLKSKNTEIQLTLLR